MIDVIIVGAGLAGLYAAKELTKTGYNVIILEGQSRVGGRVLSFPYNGGRVELGAQWIAPTHYRVHSLIAEAKLKLSPTYKKGKSLYYKINMSNEVQTNPFSLRMLVDILRFKRKLEKLAKRIPVNAPWEAQNAEFLDSQSVEDFHNQELRTDTGKLLVRRKLEEMLCKTLEDVSLLDLLWCIHTAGSINNILTGEAFWLKEGCQRLVEHLSNELQHCLHIGVVVEAIHWKKDSVTVYSKGKEWTGKTVILTVPPPTYRCIHFDPPLPMLNKQFIESVSPSFVIKCFVIYSRPFWREKGLSGTTYVGEGPVYMTVDSSINEEAGILTVIVAGNEGKSFEKLTESERREKVIKLLIKLYGEEAKSPICYMDKNWLGDPFIVGGYGVHFSPGQLTKFKDSFLKPIGPIHFAGSETALEWRLYMEGALASGERAAKEIQETIPLG
ncbi:monoamine oxidase [Evansella vedderi]|uniref:Monoamine oxidase n=2 Tax=Evansella vedderi TaxID=38282 RepID=A0ABT9ZVT9_9BACI|nr:monoamine oxidase [Evansella vedderi]